jgi:hypothetical protein
MSRGRLFWLVTFPKFALVGSVFWIEQALVLPDVRFLETLPAGSDVPQGAGRLHVGMVDGEPVVLAEQEVAGGNDATDRAELRAARLTPIVARIPRKHPLFSM